MAKRRQEQQAHQRVVRTSAVRTGDTLLFTHRDGTAGQGCILTSGAPLGKQPTWFVALTQLDDDIAEIVQVFASAMDDHALHEIPD